MLISPTSKTVLPTACALLLSACGHTETVTRDVPVRVAVPVAVDCVADAGRPAPIAALRDEVPAEEWYSRDVRQKAASVGGKALERQQYGEDLHAATGGCP